MRLSAGAGHVTFGAKVTKTPRSNILAVRVGLPPTNVKIFTGEI